MSGKLYDHDTIVEQIGNEIRKSLLPEHQTAVLNLVNTIVNEVPVPQEIFAGKSITEATQALDRFRLDLSTTVAASIRAQFIEMLTGTPSDFALDKVSERVVEYGATPEFEPETDDTPAQPDPIIPKPAQNKHMPLCTVRQIIKDRVTDEQIARVLKHASNGMIPKDIRAAGIGLSEQVIQVIINDNPLPRVKKDETTDTPPEPSDEDIALQEQEQADKEQRKAEYIKRAANRLYTQGYTVEYIANELDMTTDEVDELLPDQFDPSTLNLTPLRKEMLESEKEFGASDEEISSKLSMRPEVVAHAFNGA